MEYRVRAARITDIEALVALSGDRLGDGASGPLGAADLMRQLVFLPHATVLVAERRRDIVGGAVLAIRPSVRAGGYVGTIDLLVVDPASEPDAVSDKPHRGVPQIGGQQGMCVGRGAAAGRSGRADALEAPGVRGRAAGPPAGRRPRRAPALNRRARAHIGAGAQTIGDRVGKNVAVFVDVANIFYAAKAAGVDIDYVTLLKAGSAGRDLVRAYAYTGLDPDNENQRNFHDFLRRNGYRVVSKDIRKYGDGKVKANLDIELVVDMMKTARNLDVAIVVSGDGDFAPAIRAVQEMGVRVEVVSFRGNTSSDLMDVADLFTDITQIAKVEKGSVAIRPPGRRRRGGPVDDRGARTSSPRAPASAAAGVAAPARTPRRRAPLVPRRGRGRAVAVADAGEGAARRAAGREAVAAPPPRRPALELEEAGLDEPMEDLDVGEAIPVGAGSDEERLEDGRRRRRRRGGRGRGRGAARGRHVRGAPSEPRCGRGAGAGRAARTKRLPAPARRPASTFGSVWDSQIGISPRVARCAARRTRRTSRSRRCPSTC